MEKATKFFTMCGSLFKAGMWFLAFLFVLTFTLGTIVGTSDVTSSGVEIAGFKRIHDETIVEASKAFSARGTVASSSKPVAVIHFNGDTTASDRVALAKLVDEIIYNKDRIDSVVVVVTSPGGAVPHYGQAYAEMKRLRDAGIDLTVSIDTMAASGGYLMSVPANKIVAAPFASVGSIGVVSEMVNINEFLKSWGIEPLVFTAGERKRTVTITGEIDEAAREHFQSQLDAIHASFIAVVREHRPQVDESAFNGDHWTAQQSMDQNLGLVDEIATSHQYLFDINQNKDLIYLSMRRPPTGVFSNVLGISVDVILDRVLARISISG